MKPKRATPLRKSSASKQERAARLFDALRAAHPDAHCELNYTSPHELLVATILSAQATDVAVNKATPTLFKRFPSPAAFAASSPAEIEPFIKSLGLFRMKARAVHESMSRIVSEYGGEVPRTMELLLTLRGVARKTANVVLGNAFGINEGIVVDTHVTRLAHRFGLSKHSDPGHIEHDLMRLFPREQWTLLSHLLIFHGRRVCKARGAACTSNAVCREFCSNAKSSATCSRRRARSA